jgi:Na+-translocating ferredoxin:NAD+ oxidoreductase RnfG subunit
MVGVYPDYTIKVVRVLYQDETEGMGTLIVEKQFLAQFSGKNPDRLHVVTEGDTTDAITAVTGATISSVALAEDAVKNAVLFLKKQGIK